MKSGFSITHGSGFHMTFSNGYTLSVQFGMGNYCEHYKTFRDGDGDIIGKMKEPRKAEKWSCKDAEIAILNPKGELVNLSEIGLEDGDTVKGYVGPEEVCNYIDLVRNLPLKSIEIV